MIVARVRIGEWDQFWETFSGPGQAKRAEHGCRGVQVFRNADDPHELINVFDWDRDGWESFMADPEVPGIMRSAGLEGPPQPTFCDPPIEVGR